MHTTKFKRSKEPAKAKEKFTYAVVIEAKHGFPFFKHPHYMVNVVEAEESQENLIREGAELASLLSSGYKGFKVKVLCVEKVIKKESVDAFLPKKKK